MKIKKLETLEEHNSDRHQYYQSIQDLMSPHANGIECPKCKKELWDSNPSTTLTSSPPQKNIHCPSCGYKGYRLA